MISGLASCQDYKIDSCWMPVICELSRPKDRKCTCIIEIILYLFIGITFCCYIKKLLSRLQGQALRVKNEQNESCTSLGPWYSWVHYSVVVGGVSGLYVEAAAYWIPVSFAAGVGARNWWNTELLVSKVRKRNTARESWLSSSSSDMKWFFLKLIFQSWSVINLHYLNKQFEQLFSESIGCSQLRLTVM